MNTFTPELQKQFDSVFKPMPMSDFKQGQVDCAAKLPMVENPSDDYYAGWMKQKYNEQAAKKDYRD